MSDSALASVLLVLLLLVGFRSGFVLACAVTRQGLLPFRATTLKTAHHIDDVRLRAGFSPSCSPAAGWFRAVARLFVRQATAAESRRRDTGRNCSGTGCAGPVAIVREVS